jgi:hypothetical protein
VKLSLWLLAALALFGAGCRQSNSPWYFARPIKAEAELLAEIDASAE